MSFEQPKIEETSEAKAGQVEQRNFLLGGPESISPEGEKREMEGINFTFASNTREYRLGYDNGEPYFKITYFDALPEKLSKEEKEKFVKEEQIIGKEKKDTFVLRFGEVPDFRKEEEKEEEIHPGVKKENYVMPSREIGESGLKPEKINTYQLAELLKDKNSLLYTGAGISMGSGVFDMKELYKVLGIDFMKKTDKFLEQSIKNPEKVISNWARFSNAALEKPPTPAHESLKKIAQALNCKIFTENVDNLHEKTGIKPIHLAVRGTWLKENIKEGWLKDINTIVTVGLGRDDRGFLNWYKTVNPEGKIVAINLKRPSYLGKEDMLLKGDLQKTVPELEKKINQLKERENPKRFLEFEKLTQPNEEIKKIAEGLRGKTEQQTLENALTFLGEKIKHLDLERENPKEWRKLFNSRAVEEVLESKISYGCGDTAAAFATLMRICEIPTKFIEGKRIGKSGCHDWVEVLIGKKWTSVDPTQGIKGMEFEPEKSKHGPYVKISESLGPSDSMITSYEDWKRVEKAWDYKTNTFKKGKEPQFNKSEALR